MTFQKSPDPKTEVLRLRLTAAQKAEIEAAARARQLSVSDYALRRMLGKQAAVPVELEAIDAVAKVGLQLKEHYRKSGGQNAVALQAVLDRCVAAIDALWTQPRAPR